MGDSLIRTVLKELREEFPLVHAPDRVIPESAHAWAYCSGVLDGIEQVMRRLATMGGTEVPANPQPEEEAESTDVFSAQDRGSADSYARSSGGGGSGPGG